MSKKARKALSLLLSLVLLCGLCVPSAFAAEGTYSDTQGHWAEEAIERWSEYGIVEGNNGRFNPNASLTRAQMAKVLANTLGLTETAANPFSDVSESDWFAPYVLRCYAAGVMMGDNGKANPNATITRQQAMVMLCRALGIAPVNEPDLSAFTDSDKVGAWAAPYVAAMVESGIVGGIGNGQLAPGGNLSRAALMTILNRSVVQYINEPGTYELVNKDGIILVAAGKVTLTGKTPADILVTPAADGSTVTFDKATVTGSITVQADNAKITSKNSKLPEIAMTGEGSKVEESKPASGSSGGGGGSYVPSYSNLTVAESKTVSSGTYQNVTITDAVGDGEVTLQNLVINGDLTVQGGGSYSVKLESCVVRGRVIMAKTSGEAPRLYLTNTPIAQVEAQQPAIIEAADAASTVTAVEAKADVEVKGEQTTVTSMTVPATAEATVAVTVSAGTVEKLEVKSDATVNAEGTVSTVTAEAPVTVASGSVETITVPAGITAPVAVSVSASASVATVEAKSATTVSAADNAVVGTVSAEAPVTVASGVVNTITVPETAAEVVAIQVDSGAAVAEVAVSSSAGAAITNNGTVSAVSAANEEAQSNITASGSSATPTASSHIHSWNDGVETTAPTCTATGVRTLTCTADGCGTTKTESIAALGHNWDAGKVTTEPSCKTEGVKTYTCTACQTTKTETIAAIGGHVADSPWKTVKEATCTEAGARVRVCTRCSVEFLNSDAEGVIPALGHEYSSTWTSGGEDGHYHKCIRCDVTDTTVAHDFGNVTDCTRPTSCTACGYQRAAGQHDYGQWEITKAATCTETGSKKSVCAVCGDTQTQVIPALGHTEVTDPAVAATCTEAGKTEGKHCSVCNEVLVAQTTVDALGHDFTGNYQTDADGHWHKCTRCDATDTKTAHTYNTTNCAVAATCTVCSYEKAAGQHTWGDWTKVDGTNHKHICSSCQAEESAAHTWDDGVVTTEPTDTTEGVKTYTCSGCNGTKTEKIPPISGGSITFSETDKKITASWTGYSESGYVYCFLDQNNERKSPYFRAQDGSTTSYELSHQIPRPQSGTETYDFVLYAVTDNSLGAEIGRVEDAVEVTVSGDPAAYDMEFAYDTFTSGSYTAQKCKLTWTNGKPDGIWYAGAWFRSGNENGSFSDSIDSYQDITKQLQDGDVVDIRILKTYALDGQAIKVTMTPASTKTYVESVGNPCVTVTDAGIRVNFTLPDNSSFSLPASSDNLSGVLDAWLYMGGGIVVKQSGDNITCDSNGLCWFYLPDSFAQEHLYEANTLQLELRQPNNGSGTMEKLTNSDFVYAPTQSSSPMTQNYTAEFDEASSRVYFTGLDTSAFAYQLSCIKNNNAFETVSLLWDDSRSQYYFGDGLSWDSYKGAPIALQRFDVTAGNNKMIVTRSADLSPCDSKKVLKDTSSSNATTLTFTFGESGSISNGTFTWTTTDTWANTSGFATYFTKNQLVNNFSSSAYTKSADGKTLQAKTYKVINDIIRCFNDTKVTLGDDLYVRYRFTDSQGSAFEPFIKVTATAGDSVTSSGGSISFAGDMGYYLLSGLPGSGIISSTTANMNNGTVTISDDSSITNAAVWYWDGTLIRNNNNDGSVGSYTINLIYRPVQREA